MPPQYDNPAGRLHNLLLRLSDQNPRDTLLVGWAEVLGVDQADVILHIGGVADLVPQIQDAVDRLGDEDLRAPVARLRSTWARPIFPPDHPFNGELRAVLPGQDALEFLALVSAQLHLLAPDGTVPEDDALADLSDSVHKLGDEIRASDELPDDLKDAITMRLLDVERALAHVHVGGPDGVRRAMEAVMGTVLFRPDATTTARTSPIQKLLATLGVIWVAFSAGPKIQDSLEAWPRIVQEITSGQIVDEADKTDQPEPPDAKMP